MTDIIEAPARCHVLTRYFKLACLALLQCKRNMRYWYCRWKCLRPTSILTYKHRWVIHLLTYFSLEKIENTLTYFLGEYNFTFSTGWQLYCHTILSIQIQKQYYKLLSGKKDQCSIVFKNNKWSLWRNKQKYMITPMVGPICIIVNVIAKHIFQYKIKNWIFNELSDELMDRLKTHYPLMCVYFHSFIWVAFDAKDMTVL